MLCAQARMSDDSFKPYSAAIAEWFCERNLPYPERVDQWLHDQGYDSVEMLKLVDDNEWEQVLLCKDAADGGEGYKPGKYKAFQKAIQALRSEEFDELKDAPPMLRHNFVPARELGVASSEGSVSSAVASAKSKPKKKKRKKKRQQEAEERPAKKPAKKKVADNISPDDDDSKVRREDSTAKDAALAAELAAMQNYTYFDYVEGGRKYDARVIKHSSVKVGDDDNPIIKFLVEWREKVTPNAANAAASALSSSSSSTTMTTSNEKLRLNPEPLCTSWVRLDEFIVPSAALAYLDADDSIPPWNKEEIRKKVVAFRDQLERDNKITRMYHPDDYKEPDACGEVDFCCYLCRCGKRDELTSVQRCENINKCHRACCHGLTDEDKQERFRSSLERAQVRYEKELLTLDAQEDGGGGKKSSNDDNSSSDSDSSHSDSSNSSKFPSKKKILKEAVVKYEREKRRILQSRNKSARSRESRTDNDLALAAPDSIRLTDQVAINVHKDFSHICKEREANPELKRRAVVLDMFSGIGGAEVALKKLGIDICRVISVEHDRVASHVYRFNHDPSYGGGAPDEEIEYVSELYETFEECEENLESLVREYGPIDIIIGGPPCQSYSKVNAFRKGVHDEKNGRYMRDLAKLISKVRKYNKKHHNGFDDLFFLVENVPGAENATERYGVSEFRCDAAFFGPCVRDRVFYFNWQPDVYPDDLHPAGGSKCLANGWMMPTMFEKGIDVQAMTLLASKGRIKDDTLHKWRVLPGKENLVEPGQDRDESHGEHMLFDVNDRERLMGLPVGYVDKPVEALFQNLTRAFTIGQDTSNKEWRDVVPPKYWNFLPLGPEGYSFGIDERYEIGEHGRISLSLKEKNQRSKVCMKDFEYGWHLIGNGFSIPQVMYLLKPLQKLFKSKEYPGYTDQPFAWEDPPGEQDGGAAGAANDEAVNANAAGGLNQAQVNVKEEASASDSPVPPVYDADTDVNSSNDGVDV